MRNILFKIALGVTVLISSVYSYSQVILNADGPGNTYELINSVLAPGATAEETPDQFDPAFGRHIAEVWDAALNQYVFEFYLHVSVPNEFQDESTGDTDRQRVEIKTYASSPANLKGTPGETIIYKWKFKVPTGFQPSSNFTHIHQIKAVGGDESDPIFTLTCRKGTPNKLELNYYSNSNLSSIKFASADLTQFENTWVEATEKIYVDSIHGNYSMNIVKVSDGTKLLSYSNNDLLTYRATNTFIRPKWGIYRSLLSYQDLRDESLRFNSFSIYEVPKTGLENIDNNLTFNILSNDRTGKLKLNYTLTQKNCLDISLFSTTGGNIKNILHSEGQESGSYSKDVDVSDLAQGIYLIKFSTLGYSRTEKLFIQH